MKGEIRTLQLPVKLTQEEMLQRGERMGIVIHELNEIEVKRKAAADSFKTDRERLEEERQLLGSELKNKAKIVDVEVKSRPDWTNGKIETVRLDSMEVVAVRDMTASERQKTFDVGN